jgi:hypothetical protein
MKNIGYPIKDSGVAWPTYVEHLGYLKPIAFIIAIDQNYIREIRATKYDDEGNPIKWGIKEGNDSMSNNDGHFYIEPRPSDRDDSFYKEFRFDSVNDAYTCYLKFHNE